MSIIKDNLQVEGTITAKGFVPPAGCITQAAISAGAQIEASKSIQRVRAEHQQPNTTATTETRTLHVARYAGTVVELLAGSIVANIGAATVTFDIKKNGTTILTGVLTLNNANTARVAVTGSLNPASIAYAAGDWFEVVITATAGGGTLATGVFVQLILDEGTI